MNDTAPDSMRKTVVSRGEEMLIQLGEGDALNLYLIGHGNQMGIVLGSKKLCYGGLSTSC